jgi:signal transduction histidine kinase
MVVDSLDKDDAGARLEPLEGAQRALDEAAILFELTRRVNRATTLAELYDPALDAVLRLLRVDRAAILLFDDDGVMRFKAWRGLSDRYRAAVEGHSPWTRESRDPSPIVVVDWRDDPTLAAFAPILEAERICTLVFVPLVHAGQVLGKFLVYDARPRRFGDHELHLAEVAVAQVAQGVERARLHEAERAARRQAEAAGERAAFLAEAGAILAGSLDVRTTLQSVADLAVPRIADWCVVDLVVPEARPKLVAIAHADPRRVADVHRLAERWPPDPDPSRGILSVVRTGRALLLDEFADEIIATLPDPAWRAMLRSLALGSVMIVPMRAQGRILGTLSLVATESGRHFDSADLAMAEQLGERAGLAIANAQLYDDAMRAVALRDEFLTVAGHELRTPLTALLLQAESLVGRGELTGRDAERARRLYRQARRLVTLVDELLDVSRVRTGRLALHREALDLVALVSDHVARLTGESARPAPQIVLSATGAPHGHWDRTRLEQVVSNLVSNAIKYGAGEPVEVEVGAEADHAVLIVRDHGIGIAPEDQARIFGRFERAVSSRNYGGLGLGLWIARQIVEAHGGTIAVRSAPGQGAEFRVQLPLAAPGAS